MGCTHSVTTAGVDVVATTESSMGGANAATKQDTDSTTIHPHVIIPTVTTENHPQQQQQHRHHLSHTDDQRYGNKNNDDDGNGIRSIDSTDPPLSLQSSNRKTNPTPTHHHHVHNDDFTTDYVILKQVMVGMSALSNIYMVMKRPKSTNPSDVDHDDHNNIINNNNNKDTTNHNPHVSSQLPSSQENGVLLPQNTDPTIETITTTSTTIPSTTASSTATVTTTTTHHDSSTATVPTDAKGAVMNDNNSENQNNTNEIYVLQVIDMESVAPERRKSMRKEIIALQSIVHPNILRVHAVYDATRRDNTIATVTELCTGSHLHSSIPYPEPRAKRIIAQILDALQYMHRRKLFHNSLTTENILFQDDSQDAMIKITYAGVANLPSQSNSNNSHRFAIPEWNPSGKDIYSVGMIAYKLLSGGKEPPTDMDTQRVVPGTNLFLGRRWKLISISKNAKNFIERCLHSWDMKPQFTVEDAIQHIWMTQELVHRSDTSRPTDTTQELVVVKWNDVSNSLTASEPAVFHSTNENVPVVSLTAEQYTRDVTAKASNNDDTPPLKDSSSDHDEDSIPVFVNDAPDERINTDTKDEGVTVEETVISGVMDEPVEHTVQENIALTVPQECIEDEKTVDDIAKAVDVIEAKDLKPVKEDTEDMVTDNTAESTTPNSMEELTPNNDAPDYTAESTTPNSMEESTPNNDAPDNTAEITTPTAFDDSTPLDPSETHTPDEYVELRDAFQEVTTGTEGGDHSPVTMEAFKERLRTRYTEEEVNSWFTGNEKYEDPKSLDYKVFLRKVIQNRKSIEIQRVDTAFKKIDKGKHGYVTVGNLRAVLGKDNNDHIEQLIKAADTNRDGKISYEHFERVVQNYLSSAT